MTVMLEKYRALLDLDNGLRFSKIDHDDAMVADVYKVESLEKPCFILKICDRPNDYTSEVYFLSHFEKQIQVPAIIKTLPPSQENYGAILMEYLSGCLLKPSLITREIAFQLGKSLAIMHSNKADGPCIIHRDFRPGNIIVENNRLCGIIDWSSARASFAEDDFCSIEHGEWGDFNHHKENFLEGYSSIRKIPEYNKLMPLLRLNRAIAVIGFTVKRNTWNTTDSRPYQFNRKFVDNFFEDVA